MTNLVLCTAPDSGPLTSVWLPKGDIDIESWDGDGFRVRVNGQIMVSTVAESMRLSRYGVGNPEDITITRSQDDAN